VSEGFAVNLLPSDRPQDVYSKVLDIVVRKVAEDVQIPPDHPKEEERLRGQYARMVSPLVNRKVIKQTVMTSVYGVTRPGARAQVVNRLEEKLRVDSSHIFSPEMEREIFGAGG